MLKMKFLAALGIVASLSCIAKPVSAQGSRNIDGKGYTITGDSLTGINQRSSNEDFPTFFSTQTSGATPVNNVEQNTVTNTGYTQVEQRSLPNTLIILEPDEQNFNGNDGLQVKFDLTESE
ncbi:MAG: hypothetical protein AAF915_11095 [Cyanobacteria bacterium P01_D01_bin.50]